MGNTFRVIAISSLLVVVAVSLLLTRIATVILAATGMSRESARFQARSAFTGTGFTTKEAEEVLNHPVRRKVVMLLMLFGSAGIVAAASTTILGFRGGGVRPGWRVLELVVGLFALVALSRSRWVDRRLTSAIGRLLSRFTDIQTRDIAGLVDLPGDAAVSELGVDPGDWVAGRALAELRLRDEGIVVLAVTKPDGRHLTAPTAATVIGVGDLLVVYGRKDELCALDRRAAGPEGDAAHAAAVSRHHQLETAEGATRTAA